MKVVFNDPEQRLLKDEKSNVSIKIQIHVEYRSDDGRVLRVSDGYTNSNYAKIRLCTMHLKKLQESDFIRVKLVIDDAVMYENEIAVQNELF